MGTIMMLVATAGACMALFVKIQQLADLVTAPASPVALMPGWNFDIPSLFLLAILLTAIAIGAWKEHSAAQIMLQVTLACVGCLTLIWVSEAHYERTIRYWCQAAFAATVTLPMLARRYVKWKFPRGPKRDWWKKNCEAVFFSFMTMLLVTAGGLLQWAVYLAATAISATSVPPTLPMPVMPPGTPAGMPPANAMPAVGPPPSITPSEPPPTPPTNDQPLPIGPKGVLPAPSEPLNDKPLPKSE